MTEPTMNELLRAVARGARVTSRHREHAMSESERATEDGERAKAETPGMSDALRALAGHRVAKPEPSEPAAIAGSADGGSRGAPPPERWQRPNADMNDVLRTLARTRGGDG